MYTGSVMDYDEEALKIHRKYAGKLRTESNVAINTKEDLSVAYTPGVAKVCEVIAKDKQKAYEYTLKKRTVAVVTDGSAVLGLGNIGPEAALPVMEGKCILFKEYAGLDAFPLCLDTQDTQEIIAIVKAIAPTFGGINLEDISAPRCFEIEDALQDIGIPVMHDDQHGTAITLMGALINASKLAEKPISEMKIVINGSGAAGVAITKLLLGIGVNSSKDICAKNIVICDSKGIIGHHREDIRGNLVKTELATLTNIENQTGGLAEALKGADVFVGVSVGDVVTPDMVQEMNDRPIIFAMANPIPEIMPELAKQAGAFIVGTGRSDFPNQINNVLIFPGIFKGALMAQVPQITPEMKLAAAWALAGAIDTPTISEVLPSPLNKNVAYVIGEAVRKAAKKKSPVKTAIKQMA
jgi:malate dehydrogenase (oxaloacetate-decarboxylating)